MGSEIQLSQLSQGVGFRMSLGLRRGWGRVRKQTRAGGSRSRGDWEAERKESATQPGVGSTSL